MSNAPAPPLGRSAEADDLPAVDARLVMPGTRYEIIDGRVVYVSPADPPHATLHAKLGALLEAYAVEGYETACDMLTRTSRVSDVAPDGSVFPLGSDPVTGGRQLEELAFEIVGKQGLGIVRRKAALLSGRGVRRVFAIHVKKGCVLEWSREARRFERLDDHAVIEDRVFVLPIPVLELLSERSPDDAVARALIAKRNPVLLGELQRTETLREARGQAKALVTILRLRGIDVSPAEERRILATEDPTTLELWLSRALACASVEDLLA